MSHKIEIKVGSEPDVLIMRAQTAAVKQGMEFSGDESAGHFRGNGVEGVYEFRGDVLAITITKKPLVLPWAIIEAGVRNFFA